MERTMTGEEMLVLLHRLTLTQCRMILEALRALAAGELDADALIARLPAARPRTVAQMRRLVGECRPA